MTRAVITTHIRVLLMLLASIAFIPGWPLPVAAQTSCSGALTGTWLITLDAGRHVLRVARNPATGPSTPAFNMRSRPELFSDWG